MDLRPTYNLVWNPATGIWDKMQQSPGEGLTVNGIDESDGTYSYYGFSRSGVQWRIMRWNKSTNIIEYASGDTDFATNWTNKSSLSYSY